MTTTTTFYGLMELMDIQRNDLCTLGAIPAWKATYPVGGTVVFPDIATGADTAYTVVSVYVDDHPTFHPNTDEANYRCSALLRPSS
jgi:hypothetical protein